MKSIFQIIDIGEDDIDILDLLNELPVVVENNELFKLKQNEQNIKNGHNIKAEVYSEDNNVTFYFKNLQLITDTEEKIATFDEYKGMVEKIYFYLNQLWNDKIESATREKDGKIVFYEGIRGYISTRYNKKENINIETIWGFKEILTFLGGDYKQIQLNNDLNELLKNTDNNSKKCNALFNGYFLNTINPVDKKYFDNNIYYHYVINGILISRINPVTIKDGDSDISYTFFLQRLKKSGGWETLYYTGEFDRDYSSLPIDQQNVHKVVQNYILNIHDFINHPEVEIIEKPWYNNKNRLKRKQPLIPTTICINILGKLKKYVYDTLKQNEKSWEIGHRFWVRSHWMEFKHERYKNRQGQKTWILPYIKGKGKLIKKDYYVGEMENHWVHEAEMIKIIRELYPEHEIEKHNRTILDGLEIDCYIPELKLGFEYNGLQHYEHVEHFHKTIEEFEAQKSRDVEKLKRAGNKGIKIITIRYDEAVTKETIKEKLK